MKLVTYLSVFLAISGLLVEAIKGGALGVPAILFGIHVILCLILTVLNTRLPPARS
jgi:hypothetical protein